MSRYSVAACLALACAAQDEARSPPVVATQPRDYDALTGAAQVYLTSGNAARALELCQEAIAMQQDRPEGFLWCGRSHAALGQLAESAQSYEQARSRGLKERSLYAELASVYDVSKRYDEAIATYQSYLELTPDDADLRHELGLTLTLVRRYDEAIAALKQAAQLRPSDAQMQLDIGYALLQAERFTEATTHLRTSLALQPTLSDGYVFLAHALLHAQNFEAALATVNAGIAAAPSDALRDLHKRLLAHQEKYR